MTPFHPAVRSRSVEELLAITVINGPIKSDRVDDYKKLWKGCRPLCKSLSREKTILLTRATEERAIPTQSRIPSSHVVPLGDGSCLRRT